MTAQYLRAQSRTRWTDRSLESSVYYNDIGNTFPAGFINQAGYPYDPNANYSFDKNGVFTSGTIIRRNNRQARNVPASQACVIPNDGFPYTSTYCDYPQFVNPGGLNTVLTNRFNDGRTKTQDFALNLKFAPTDNLHLNFDGQYVKSSSRSTRRHRRHQHLLRRCAGYQRRHAEDLVRDPWLRSAELLHPAEQRLLQRFAYNNRAINDGDEYAFRGDIQYDFSDDSFLRSVRAGGR